MTGQPADPETWTCAWCGHKNSPGGVICASCSHYGQPPAASSEPVSAEDLHLLIAEAKGLAGLGMDKGYDDLLYKLCDALDECLAALASARGETSG